MKTLTKKLWVSMLTLALIFCTVCGIIFTNPSAVLAEETEQTTTTPNFENMPCREFIGIKSIMGKLLKTTPDVGFIFDALYFIELDEEITVGLYTGDGDDAPILSTVEGEEFGAITEYGCEWYFIDGYHYIKVPETITITYKGESKIIDNQILTGDIVGPDNWEAYELLPLDGYVEKELEEGDVLNGKMIKLTAKPFEGSDGSGWSLINLDGICIVYYGNENGGWRICREESNDPIDSFMETYEYENGDVVVLVWFPDYITNSIYEGKYEDDFEIHAYELTEPQDTTPNEPTDGEQSEEDKTQAVKSWFANAWEDIKTFCAENTVAVICIGICALSVVVCIIACAKKKRR